MSNDLFATALGVTSPWSVRNVAFDGDKRLLTISIDFAKGSRFPYPGVEGRHPVHDTQTKRYRHLNFFQHECYLEVRTPRIKLPDGRVVLAEPDWAGKLSGFTLLFEALILAMCRQMPFAAVARLAGESWHRVQAICQRYVDLALARADLSRLTKLTIDETSSRRGHNYLTFAADAEARKVVFVTEGRDAKTISELGQFLG
jgi:transposase